MGVIVRKQIKIFTSGSESAAGDDPSHQPRWCRRGAPRDPTRPPAASGPPAHPLRGSARTGQGGGMSGAERAQGSPCPPPFTCLKTRRCGAGCPRLQSDPEAGSLHFTQRRKRKKKKSPTEKEVSAQPRKGEGGRCARVCLSYGATDPARRVGAGGGEKSGASGAVAPPIHHWQRHPAQGNKLRARESEPEQTSPHADRSPSELYPRLLLPAQLPPRLSLTPLHPAA